MLDAETPPVDESEQPGLTISAKADASYRRTYPQTSEAVGRARRDIVEFAKACGFAGQTLSDIEVSVGEGLANAVEHAHRDDRGLDVAVQRDATWLIVEIKDRGSGFDYGKICARSRPPIGSLRGFGTFIMRELMDEIWYTEAGTRLRLIKRLPFAEADERSAAQA